MTRRFDNRAAQQAIALFGGVVGVLGFLMALRGDWSGLGIFVLGIGTVARGLRSSSVRVTPHHVETRSIVRTRRYSYSDLDSVAVLVGQTGMNGFGREHLEFRFRDGTKQRFTELNCKPPPAPDGTSVVRDAAAAIIAHLDHPPSAD